MMARLSIDTEGLDNQFIQFILNKFERELPNCTVRKRDETDTIAILANLSVMKQALDLLSQEMDDYFRKK